MLAITIRDDKTIDITIKVKDGGELTKALEVVNGASCAINVNDGEAVPTVRVLYLRDCGEAKLQCVKAIKENLCMCLKEAKDICDSVSLEPKQEKVEITRSLDINYLNRLKDSIEESGATCFIKEL